MRSHGLQRISIAAAMLVLAACTTAPATTRESASAIPMSTSSATAGTKVPGLAVRGTFSSPVRACAGPTDWAGVPDLIRRLADAWHEPDSARRLAILDEVWAKDGVYQDPYSDPATGRAALSDVMGFGVAPGQYLELRSWEAGDLHHQRIRMSWRHCCPSGIPLLEGTDIATIGADGRITKVVSFWNEFIEAPAETACDGPPGSPSGNDEPTAAAAEVCTGPDVDWSAIPAVAQGYGRAWNERDAAVRLALLEDVWAARGSYVDAPQGEPVRGRAAFVEHIEGFHAAGYGAYFEPRPFVEGDQHHNYLRMPWRFCDDDGNVVWVGEDVAELDEDGRISSVVGFFYD